MDIDPRYEWLAMKILKTLMEMVYESPKDYEGLTVAGITAFHDILHHVARTSDPETPTYNCNCPLCNPNYKPKHRAKRYRHKG